MKRFAITVLVVGVLSGCAAAAPTPAPTLAPSPASTPVLTSTPVPSATPSPTSTAIPTTTALSPAFPALTEQFTSAINGMTVSYPSGWHLQPATEPWTGEFVQQDSPFADVIYQKESDSPFIALASQPLAGQSSEDWTDAYVAQLVADDASCATTDPITVDGAAAVLSDACSVALVSDGERGYLIWLYRGDDSEWFKAILATIQLEPDEAVDTAP